MKVFQKILVFLVVLSLIISPMFNIFTSRPKNVEAGGVFGSIMDVLKEYVLDPIVWMIKDRILKYVEQKIIDWGTGKKSDIGSPFAVGNWVDFFLEALDTASAKFVNEFELTRLCQPLKISLGERFQLTTYYLDKPTYQTRAACTIGDIVENVENFYENPSIQLFGWDAWSALMQPNNNLFGSYFLAKERLNEITDQETKAADKETDVSGGYKNETITTKTDIEACREKCLSSGDAACQQQCDSEFAICMDIPGNTETDCLIQRNFCYSTCPSLDPGVTVTTCLNKCEEKPGISVEKTIKNWGSNIHETMTSALGSYMGELISAKEISELIGVLYSALLTKAVNGLGLAFTGLFSNNNQRQRAAQKNQFSYQRDFKANMTPAVQKSTRGQVLSGILKSIQQLDRSQTSCNKDEMMTYNEWAKSVNDVVSPNVESLYIGLEGMNLKPDYEILDSRFAPYRVYGYSYGEVPSAKIPDACRAIIKQYFLEAPRNLSDSAANLAALNSSCKSIESGLEPPTPDQDIIGFNASTTPCSICMYDHDALNCVPGNPARMPYPTGPTEPWSETDLALKGNFYNECKNTYNITISRCDDCLKKVDEKCGQLKNEQKNECIGTVCNNYRDIMDSFVDSPRDPEDFPTQGPLKFYEKCLIEEKKEACFTCLREYFVPDTYCEQAKDYVARSIDKYPAVVYNNGGQIYGPADASITSKGGECSSSTIRQPMALSLLCRIMPEYGGGACRTSCMGHGMTTEELNDITDFRPFDTDCNQARVARAGEDPWNPINDGARQAKSKCCASFWVHDRNIYAECAGAGTGQEPTGHCPGGGPKTNPECYCEEGWRPIAGTHLRLNFACPGGVCPVAADPTCRSSCEEDPFEVPNMSLRGSATLSTNVVTGGSTVYVSSGTCNDPDYVACIKKTAQRTFFEKLARIFRPRIPYAIAAEDCDCWIDNNYCMYVGPSGFAEQCANDQYCDTSGESGCWSNDYSLPDPPGGFVTRDGYLTFAGDCDCDSNNDCPSGGYYCDLPVEGYAPCTAGQYNGKCKLGETGTCDYIAGAPAGAICSSRTTHGNGATDCCYSGGEEGNTSGETIECDLSVVNPGDVLRVGVANELTTDCNTGALLCIQCSENDPDYGTGGGGFYNTGRQQCYGKIVW